MSTISPSKKYLFRVLKSFLLKKKDKDIGLDLASENFKNSVYFKTKKYIGIDNSLKEILYGLKYFKAKNRYGILWDFTKKNCLGKNFADVVVSTNTFSHIKSEKKKIIALNNFIEVTANNGSLFLEVENKKKETIKLINIIKKKFYITKIYYYNNFLSQIYLSCFSGELTKNFYAKFLNRIKINYIISIIENLTPNIEFLNSKLIIVGEKKKSTGNKKIKFKFKRLNKFI